jgi:hypothetical protein
MAPSKTCHTIFLGNIYVNNGSKLDKIINTNNILRHRPVAAPKKSQSQDDEKKNWKTILYNSFLKFSSGSIHFFIGETLELLNFS